MTAKPLGYHARKARQRTAVANEMLQKREENIALQEANVDLLHEKAIGNTFRSFKNTKQRKKEALHEKQNATNEFLTETIGRILYGSLPLENTFKVDYASKIQDRVVDQFHMLAEKNPELGVSPLTVDYNQVNMSTNPAEFMRQLGESRYQASTSYRNENTEYGRTSVIDLLNMSDSQLGNEAQATIAKLQESFIDKTTKIVHEKVIKAIASETQKSQIDEFINESVEDNKFFKSGNKDLIRKSRKSSVFGEIYKNCLQENAHLLTEGVESEKKDLIMAEAILEYTLLETFSTLGLVDVNSDQFILDQIKHRQQLNNTKL